MLRQQHIYVQVARARAFSNARTEAPSICEIAPLDRQLGSYSLDTLSASFIHFLFFFFFLPSAGYSYVRKLRDDGGNERFRFDELNIYSVHRKGRLPRAETRRN